MISAAVTELHKQATVDSAPAPPSTAGTRNKQAIPQLIGSLKAGSDSWATLLTIPAEADHNNPCVWQIDIYSEVIFTKKTVSYELLLCTANVQETSISIAASKNLQGSVCAAIDITRSHTTQDVWAVPKLAKDQKAHLVVCSHGLHGSRLDMLYIKERLEQRFGAGNRDTGGVVVLASDANHTLTEQGVEACSERLARYILGVLEYNPSTGRFPDELRFDRISLVGHSLGGLIVLHTAGILSQLTSGEIFRRLKPCNIITMASPILGVKSSSIYPVKFALAAGAIGQTGRDLALVPTRKSHPVPDTKEHESNGSVHHSPTRNLSTPLIPPTRNLSPRLEPKAIPAPADMPEPLLLQMAKPGSIFHDAIHQFQERTAYANLINDSVVPFKTSVLWYVDLATAKESVEVSDDVPEEIPMETLSISQGHVSNAKTTFEIPSVRISTDEDRWEDVMVSDDEEKPTEHDNTPTKTTELVATAMSDPVPSPEPIPDAQKSPTVHSSASREASPALDGTVADKLSSFFTAVRKRSFSIPITSPSPTTSATSTPPMTPSRSIEPSSLASSKPTPPVSPKPVASFDPLRSLSALLNNPSQYLPSFTPADPTAPAQKLDPLKAIQDILDPPLPKSDMLEFEPDEEVTRKVLVHDGLYGTNGKRIHDVESVTIESKSAAAATADLSLEEQIAAHWHSDMIWRKRVVSLDECDAHLSIFVRRRWFNVHGWGVIEALVNGHEWA